MEYVDIIDENNNLTGRTTTRSNLSKSDSSFDKLFFVSLINDSSSNSIATIESSITLCQRAKFSSFNLISFCSFKSFDDNS